MDLKSIDQNFGQAVRLLRQDREMSQDELANRVTGLGYPLSQATIGKIERGDRKVTVGEGEALARALGTNTSTLIAGPSYITREALSSRLRQLRSELMEAMSVFESAQQLVAIEANRLEDYDVEWIRSEVLESLEDVVSEYRKDRTSENASRRQRDEMDMTDEERAAAPRRVEGLWGEYDSKFGDTVERIPVARAWQTILRGRPEPEQTDG